MVCSSTKKPYGVESGNSCLIRFHLYKTGPLGESESNIFYCKFMFICYVVTFFVENSIVLLSFFKNIFFCFFGDRVIGRSM